MLKPLAFFSMGWRGRGRGWGPSIQKLLTDSLLNPKGYTVDQDRALTQRVPIRCSFPLEQRSANCEVSVKSSCYLLWSIVFLVHSYVHLFTYCGLKQCKLILLGF